MTSAVVPLGAFANYFGTMEETVNATATIKDATSSRFWYSGKGEISYAVTGSTVAGTSLSFSESGTTVSAELREIVYLLNFVSTGVGLVVMVFHAGQRRIGVTVTAQTFADLLSYAARAYGVLVSTVASDHTKTPAVSGTVSGNFPNVKVAFEGRSGPSPNSALNPATARIAVVSGAPAGAMDARPMLMGAIQPGTKYFGVLLPSAVATLAHVETLGHFIKALLKGSVVETTTARAALTIVEQSATWVGNGGSYAIRAGELSMPSQEKAQLTEVIYVIGNGSSVVAVLLVFNKSGLGPIVVHVDRDAFKRHFLALPNVWGVSVSTVAHVPGVHNSVPALTDALSYPKIGLTFTRVQYGVPGASALADEVPRIWNGVLHHYNDTPARFFGVVPTAVSTQPASSVSAPIFETAAPAAVMTVELLDVFDRGLLDPGVVETVAARAPIGRSSQGAAWAGWGGQYMIGAGGLTMPTTTTQAPLIEVVYVVTRLVVTDVTYVLLVFKHGAKYVAVKLLPKTFVASFTNLASGSGVSVSTIAMNALAHDSVPVVADAASYPKLALSFQSSMSSVPESAIATGIPRIVTTVTGGVLRYTTAPAKIFGVDIVAWAIQTATNLAQKSAANLVQKAAVDLAQIAAGAVAVTPAAPPSLVQASAPEQRSITVAGVLRDQALNGIYELADPPTTPLEWRLIPASAKQAKIYLAYPGVMILEFTKDDGTQSKNIAFKVTDGTPAPTLEISNRDP